MVLEATVVCIDNSAWVLNGDWLPSRLEAQRDAANILCGAKTNDNPENSVGLLTMAGEHVEVRVTPTQDLGQMLKGLHDIPVGGKCDIVLALQTAQLALKHRVNKNQRQRIVVFIASPIEVTDRQLDIVGKNLKKNNVQLDIISFGLPAAVENHAQLSRLYNSVNSNDSSHFLEITEEGETRRILSDCLLATPIIRDIGSDGVGAGGGAPLGGVDPNVDPELYMALQMSLQEEQERQARAAAVSANEVPATRHQEQDRTDRSEAPQQQEDTVENNSLPDMPSVADIEAMTRLDPELRQALILSLSDLQQSAAPPDISSNQPPPADNVELHRTTSMEIMGGGDAGVIPPEDPALPFSPSQEILPHTDDAELVRALERLANADKEEEKEEEEGEEDDDDDKRKK